MANRFSIEDLVHPLYEEYIEEWTKWRLTYESGKKFILRYLKTYSKRESEQDFILRKDMTYVPAYAQQAVDEIKNAIFSQMTEVERRGGSEKYQKTCEGLNGGVDLLGRSMNCFIGTRILPELLSMSRVGLFLDMPALSGITMAEDIGIRPYIYTYKVEDIRTWRTNEYRGQIEYSNLLLRDYIFKYDDETGLPIGEIQRFRRLWLEDGVVHCRFYTENEEPNPEQLYISDGEDVILDIPRIPFVVAQISHSLLINVANYQIALMNLESSDISYILKSNFPFYTEQYEPKASSQYTRASGLSQGGEAIDAMTGKSEEVKVGTAAGRRYPKGLDRPQFINPSSDPLKISMEKQEQMKRSIRQLVMLAVSNLEPQKMASAESKAADNQGLETGLATIGYELENVERRIAQYWASYEKSNKPAVVFYPEKYEIKSDSSRLDEAKKLTDLVDTIPSNICKKEISKRVATLLLKNKVENNELENILNEIEQVKAVCSGPEIIQKDIELGLVSLELASEMRGYPEGEVEKAKEDHADRLARIAESQSENTGGLKNPASRGIKDLGGNPNSDPSKEKKQSLETATDSSVKNKQRGPGK